VFAINISKSVLNYISYVSSRDFCQKKT